MGDSFYRQIAGEFMENPEEYGFPEGSNDTVKEVLYEDYPSLAQEDVGDGLDRPDVPDEPAEPQVNPAAEAYVRQREALMNQQMAAREAALREREQQLAIQAAAIVAGQGQYQPEQDVPDNAFDQAVDERVNARLAPIVQELQRKEYQQGMLGNLQNMIQTCRNDRSMPEFERIAGLGSDIIGTEAALSILRSNSPVDAGRKLYTIGMGGIRANVQPQVRSEEMGYEETAAPVQEYMPPAPRRMPRGMSVQGGGGNRAPSWQSIDEMLAGDDMSSEEYERFSREHPQVLKRYLQYGTTDPSYTPTGEWNRGSSYFR